MKKSVRLIYGGITAILLVTVFSLIWRLHYYEPDDNREMSDLVKLFQEKTEDLYVSTDNTEALGEIISVKLVSDGQDILLYEFETVQEAKTVWKNRADLFINGKFLMNNSDPGFVYIFVRDFQGYSGIRSKL